MPLSTDVLSGERADDGIDIPIIKRMRSGLNKTGLLFLPIRRTKSPKAEFLGGLSLESTTL
jgi:hypothetical protein